MSCTGVVTNVYQAPDIKTAEAATGHSKMSSVTSNIAPMKALSRDLCPARASARTKSPKAAGIKWNFRQYRPGMVYHVCTGLS